MLILCWASVIEDGHTSIYYCQSNSGNTIGLHHPNVFLMLGLCRKQWTASIKLLQAGTANEIFNEKEKTHIFFK